MNSIAGWVVATAMAIGTLGYPQKSMAGGFNGKEFLTWSTPAQDSYIQTSVTMAAIIATKTRPVAGDCLDAWYLNPGVDRQGRNTEIRAAIGRNSEFHPSAVIFLILEQACGPFSE